MHTLQPKTSKLSVQEKEKFLKEKNIAIAQLPKIRAIDPSAPEGCETGDVVKIERKMTDKTVYYYRVVV